MAKLMTLEMNDLLKLSRIAESISRSDPELARTLASPLGRRRFPWMIAAHVTLAVCALLALAGLVVGDATPSVAGGLTLLTAYPFLLVMARQRPVHELKVG
jgi:hypothetical protein